MNGLERLAFAIMRRALPPSEREWILGDIQEEWDRVACQHGAAAARVWLAGELIRTALGAARLRLAIGRQPSVRRGDNPMRAVLQDVRYGVRLLLRAPGFAAVAILTVGLGIGANATIFSVVHGVLMEPLPYDAPERLVRLYDSNDREPAWPVAPANFITYRASVDAFEGLAAYGRGDLQIGGDRPEQLRGMGVSAGFFTMLGWRPALGRDFTTEEELPGRGDVAILSHSLWQRRFGGDPAIVGTTVRLSDRPFVIVGVLPAGFQHVGGTYRSYEHGETVDIWWVGTLPPVPAERDRRQHFLNVVGRLKPGVTLEQAQQALTAAAARLAAQYPDSNAEWTARISPLRDDIVGSAEPMLLVLLGAVQVVLLLACVNVAGLLLGRATLRGREIGVRSALGATRVRLVRQLVVESLVLAAAGGALGVTIAVGAVRLLPLVGPADTPRLAMIAVDWTVVAYTIGATFLTAVLFGLIPALQLARSNVNSTLAHGGRGTAGAPGYRLRSLLVAAEIALAFVLVVGAGLLLRSFARLSAVDPGFRAEDVLTARLSLPRARYPDTASAAAFYTRLRERTRSIPGVRDAGLGSALPWTGYDENTTFGIVGRTFPPKETPEARFHMVTPGYFSALAVPLLAGRDFGEGDTAPTPAVVVINERLARRYWSGADPVASAVGARLDLWGEPRTIVGVVGDVRDTPWADAAEPALYFPQAQQSYGQDMLLAVASDLQPESLAGPLMQAVRQIDPALPLANVTPLESVSGQAFAARRFLLVLVGAFGLTALFLAVVGVYGVMAQAVGQRVQEFGVRQALGARPSDILRLVMKGAAVIGAGGAALGMLLGLLSTQWLASSLYGVAATDPLTFAAVAMLLLTVALGASYIPARRAMRVEPAVALRGDS
jgi:predicted permease